MHFIQKDLERTGLLEIHALERIADEITDNFLKKTINLKEIVCIAQRDTIDLKQKTFTDIFTLEDIKLH